MTNFLFVNKLIVTSLWILFLFSLVFVVTVISKPSEQLQNSITLDMYVLRANGSKASSNLLCNTNNNTKISYGCTAYPNDVTHEYPFNTNTITIGMESHLVNGEQQGYLHNVTPKEVAITVASQGNKPLSCVKAQAVAARTFAYYHIQRGSNINNSTDYQVYIPYSYHTFTTAQQQRVDDAMNEVIYMTTSGNTAPIRAHFGADNDITTSDGGESYLKSIYDPISHLGSDYGTSNGGMSSKGCSRWSFGHTSSRGAVAPDNSNYPGDNRGDGDFWSVRYDNVAQILTHYYTGIAIRDSSGQNILPAYRWNPLSVDWGGGTVNPPDMLPSSTYNVNIQLQNRGTFLQFI